MKNTFNFNVQLKMSHGVAMTLNFREILLSEIPTAIDVKQSEAKEDKHGTDWWVIREYNRPISVDLKARSKDYKSDDLALETWSVVEKKIIGWTRDITKSTDYILWFWEDTKKWCLIPFPLLCRVFCLNWEYWSEIYKTAQQSTKNNTYLYHSECVFVPRVIVWNTIINHYSNGFN